MRAGEHAAEHHRVAAEEQRLHERAVALDAAVGDERHAAVGRRAALDQRLDLRHAEVRVEPRRAAAARTDADLDAVDAALDQEAHALGRGDVAGDQLDVAELLAERLDGARHHHGVAVRDVDDDDVGAGAQQLGGALEVVALRADRRADAQPALRVARGERQLLLLDQVLGRDQAEQAAVRVDERQLLDLVRAHHVFGGRAVDDALAHDEPFARRHAIADRARRCRRSAGRASVSSPTTRRASSTTTSVPTPVRRIISAASVSAALGPDRVRVDDDAVLPPLDALDLAHLRLDVARSGSRGR